MNVAAFNAEALKRSAKHDVGVLDQATVVLAQRRSERRERLRRFEGWQEAGELRKTPIVGHLPRGTIGPQGAAHVNHYRPQHRLH